MTINREALAAALDAFDQWQEDFGTVVHPNTAILAAAAREHFEWQTERAETVEDETTERELWMISELRRTLGLFDGAMPKSPRDAWEEAMSELRRREPLSVEQRRRMVADTVPGLANPLPWSDVSTVLQRLVDMTDGSEREVGLMVYALLNGAAADPT